MRRTLSIIIIPLLFCFSCKPYKGFQKITNIKVEALPARHISINQDSLEKTVQKYNWRKLRNISKEDLMNKIKKTRIEKIKDIKADTSNITKLYLTGTENHVILYGKNKTDLNNLSDSYDAIDWQYESNDSIYSKIEIGRLDRNTGNSKLKIIYPELKRFAILDLDTRYSSIHIHASAIKPKLKLENTTHRDTNTNYPVPDFIEVIPDEAIYIFYEIPNRE